MRPESLEEAMTYILQYHVNYVLCMAEWRIDRQKWQSDLSALEENTARRDLSHAGSPWEGIYHMLETELRGLQTLENRQAEENCCLLPPIGQNKFETTSGEEEGNSVSLRPS
ncbi:hypothetical protein PoB_005939100 [Plakobranchus ocellatus]|uniref:Uncharacterized protein n=1 Tax=Plakobranchus ocellatus TaxID=259542 RepID=A0AAV4CJ30_9GAST|nr:hypothetical protein PoB_005939100 [Plakobranchus ocellatus]